MLLHNAERIAKARLSAPVVVAGNADAATEVAGSCARPPGAGSSSRPTCCPASASSRPEAARAAIREAFLTHVIGGKGLSRGRGFAELVRAPTPDAVLRGVEVLADVAGGDVLVVDVGGATTDVYSVVTPAGRGRDAAHARSSAPSGTRAPSRATSGMRWTAVGVVEAAARERIAVDGALRRYAAAVAARPRPPGRHAMPSGPPRSRPPSTAAVVAVRRHGRPAAPVGADRARSPTWRWSSGPAACCATRPARVGDRVLPRVTDDHGGGWRVPERAAPAGGRRVRALRRRAARRRLPRGGGRPGRRSLAGGAGSGRRGAPGLR